MTFEIITVLVIIGTAVFFFVTEWLRMDLVALLVLLSLAVTGLVDPKEAVSGFNNPAVITVRALFILTTETVCDRRLCPGRPERDHISLDGTREWG